MGNRFTVPFTTASATHMMVEIFLFMHPAILPLLMKEFEITFVQAGLFLTIPSVVQLSFNIPSGALADRIDSRYLLSLSAALSGFGAIIVSQSPNIICLVFGLCIIKTAVTTYHPTGLSVISKIFSKGKLTRMIGIHGATGSIGQGLGIISMGFMIAGYEWRLCYLLWSTLLFVWSIILLKIPLHLPQLVNPHVTKEFDGRNEESQLATGWKQNARQIISGKSFLVLIFAMSMVSLGNQIISSFVTTYFVQIRNMPEDTAALIFGIGPIIGVLGSLIGGYLGSRFGDKKFLALVLFGIAVFVFNLAYAPLLGFMILSFLIYSWFFASMWPTSTSLVSILTTESGRGMAYSIFFLVPGTLGAVSPVIGALIIEGFGVLSIFSFSFALFLSSSVIILLIKNSK